MTYRSKTKGRQIDRILASRVSPQPEIPMGTVDPRYYERVTNYFRAGITAMQKLSPKELQGFANMIEGYPTQTPRNVWEDMIRSSVAEAARALAVSNKMDAAK